MSHQQILTSLPDLQVEQEPSSTFLTDRHRNAVERLKSSYEAQRPLAVMIGEGRRASRFVIRSFLTGLPEDVAVARIADPCVNATEFMSKVIAAVGFQGKDMSLDDLEGVFTMFLSFQKSHSRRTIICIERAQDSELWVLDKIRNLVEQERNGHFGLMIIISGQDELKELLRSGPLSTVSSLAGKRIMLPPFTLSETKKFIRRRLDSAGTVGIDQLFQYKAITRIHELAMGVPDSVAALVNSSIEMADTEGVELVTAELVQRTHEQRQAALGEQTADPFAETVTMNGIRPPTAHLIYQLSGEEVQDLSLRQGHTLIGRSKICDVCVNSSTVSRQHALISYTPDGATLVDLNSTNGTFVDGYEVQRHELEPE